MADFELKGGFKANTLVMNGSIKHLLEGCAVVGCPDGASVGALVGGVGAKLGLADHEVQVGALTIPTRTVTKICGRSV